MTQAPPMFVDVAAGQAVFREGDKGSDMFIIESGQVDILRAERGAEPVATLGPGDFFGEMAVLEDQPRFASAIAKSAARLLRIDRSAFADVLRANVEIAIRIMRKLSARQRRAEQRTQEVLDTLKSMQAMVMAKGAAGDAQGYDPSKTRRTDPALVKAAARRNETAPSPVAANNPAPVGAAAASPRSGAKSGTQGPALRHSSGSTFPLSAERNEFLVGRPDPVTGTTPEINLGGLDAQRSLSRRHAKILREGTTIFVREEVGAANGTFLNGERVKTGVNMSLSSGDRLRFGSVELEFVAE